MGLIAATLVSFAGKQLVSMGLGVASFNSEAGLSTNNSGHHSGGRTLIRQIYSQGQETSPKERRSNSNVSLVLILKTPGITNRAIVYKAITGRVSDASPSSSPFSLRI
jgi:phosphoribosylaminoimidazole (AIR) synthetase